jgi:hypothetical protein
VADTNANPLFPFIYRFGSPIFDRLFYNRYRRAALAHATGQLLMVGLGPGTDLKFVPAAVTSVAAVEPVAVFRRTASRLAVRHGIAADIVDGTGESIPFPDNSFDSVHIGLVLCSVDDVAATLSGWWFSSMFAGRAQWAGSRTWSQSHGHGWRPVASRTDARSTPLRRPASIPRDCAASREPRCRSRANRICKDSRLCARVEPERCVTRHWSDPLLSRRFREDVR